MSLVIPNSWLALKLGDVVRYGRTEKAEPESIPDEAWILELEDVEKDTSRILQRHRFAERRSKSTKNRFSAGDVLYGKLRPYLNKVVLADADGYCTTEIIPIKGNEAVDARFIFRWLKHPAFLEYVSSVSHGINMPRLGTEAGNDAPFVLAPLAEQKRIADKLDRLLARADACRERLDRMPTILKRFRQSVLAAATSGKLTEDWRGSSRMVDWRPTKVQDICISVADGDHQAPPQVLSGIPFITISALNNGRLDLEKATRYVPETYFLSLAEKRRPKRGDVLYSVTGSIGIPALVDSDKPFTFQRHVAILKPDLTQVSSSYLLHLLGSNQVKEQAIEVATGTAQMTIPLGGLRMIEVDLPPIEEQAEIVRRVQSLFALADRLEVRYTAARTQVERLTPSLLAKAFRGELVPQDPNDEPASAMLERLKAQTSPPNSSGKSLRGRRPKTAPTQPKSSD